MCCICTFSATVCAFTRPSVSVRACGVSFGAAVSFSGASCSGFSDAHQRSTNTNGNACSAEEGEEEVQLCLSLAAEKVQHAQCAEYKRGINGLTDPLHEWSWRGFTAESAERVSGRECQEACRINLFVSHAKQEDGCNSKETVEE